MSLASLHAPLPFLSIVTPDRRSEIVAEVNRRVIFGLPRIQHHDLGNDPFFELETNPHTRLQLCQLHWLPAFCANLQFWIKAIVSLFHLKKRRADGRDLTRIRTVDLSSAALVSPDVGRDHTEATYAKKDPQIQRDKS